MITPHIAPILRQHRACWCQMWVKSFIGSLFFSVILVPTFLWAANGEETIAIIVNKANIVSDLPLTSVAQIYRGQMANWPNGQHIHIIDRSEGSGLKKQFYRDVLNAKPNRLFFLTGSPVPMKTMKVNTDLSTRKFVARMPNAIAYIPLSAVDDSVRIVAKVVRNDQN